MAITEHDRHLMYLHLEEVLGSETASKLMEHLPPVGWADVATKRDLDQLGAATKRDLEHLAATTTRDLEHLAATTTRDLEHLHQTIRLEMAELRTTFERGMRQQLMWVIGAMTAWSTVIVAAVRF